jgi:hypothetical protein
MAWISLDALQSPWYGYEARPCELLLSDAVSLAAFSRTRRVAASLGASHHSDVLRFHGDFHQPCHETADPQGKNHHGCLLRYALMVLSLKDVYVKHHLRRIGHIKEHLKAEEAAVVAEQLHLVPAREQSALTCVQLIGDSCCTYVLVLVFVVFLVLRLDQDTEVGQWPWWAVFSPLFLAVGIVTVNVVVSNFLHVNAVRGTLGRASPPYKERGIVAYVYDQVG